MKKIFSFILRVDEYLEACFWDESKRRTDANSVVSKKRKNFVDTSSALLQGVGIFRRSVILAILAMFLILTLNACNESLKQKTATDLSAKQNTNNPLSELLKNSNKAAVIKFHAEWCSTCKSYAPKFKAVKEEYRNKVDFFEVDVDDSNYKELVKYAKISRIPDTFFVSTDRQNVSRKLGSISENKLSEIIEELLIN